MKLEIMGFSQQGLINLGLDNNDALLLRWFIDYQGTQKMKAIPNTEDGKVYFWVNFKKLCEDLPIITGSDRYMARKFDKLVAAGVLAKFSSIGPMGKYSAYRIGDGDQYMSLIESMSPNGEAMSVNGDMAGADSDMAKSPTGDMQSNLNRLPSNNNTVDSLQEDIVSSEVPKTGTPSPSPAVLQIPLNDKTTYGVTQVQIDKWSELYPAVDVPQQLRQMIGWCDGNPKRCKTRTGVLRFINSWLSREQDRGGKRSTGVPAFSTTRTPVSNAAHDGLQGGEIVW